MVRVHLKQFNPDDVDYGSWIERERRAFIEARLKNPYFLYSLGTSIALLLATAVYAKLWIDHRRSMWITAEMMADIYNRDAYSRRIAQKAIEKYNTHIERCNRAIEAAEHGEAVSTTGSEFTVRQRIELETSINHFLYLVPHYDLSWFVADKLNCKRAVYFGLLRDFLQETLALPVRRNGSPASVPLASALTQGKEQQRTGTLFPGIAV